MPFESMLHVLHGNKVIFIVIVIVIVISYAKKIHATLFYRVYHLKDNNFMLHIITCLYFLVNIALY